MKTERQRSRTGRTWVLTAAISIRFVFRSLLFAVVASALLPGSVRGAMTTGNVSWSGGAGAGNPYWNVDANWLGGQAPTNPTSATISFWTNSQNLASTLDADRTIGTLYSWTSTNASTAGDSRTNLVNLGGHTLMVTNMFGGILGYQNARNIFVLTNGTVQIGTTAKAVNLSVLDAATLKFAPGTTLNAVNLGTLTVDPNNYISSYLDLSGVTVTEGTLEMNALSVLSSSSRAGRIYLSASTAVNSFRVRGATTLGGNLGHSGNVSYIGDPGNTFNFESQNYGMFPAGVDLTLGVSTASRGSLTSGCGTSYRSFLAIKAAGGGGRFTAYLSSLKLGDTSYSGGNVITIRDMLDVSAMDSCLFNVQTLQVGNGIGPTTPATDDARCVLAFPPGTGTVFNATIGAPAGIGYAKLSLSNTLFTVTGTLTLQKTAQALVAVGAGSNGLKVTGTLTDAGGTVTATFLDTPAPGGLIWALRIPGDSRGTLQTMVDAGRLTSPTTAPSGFRVGVLYDEGNNVTMFALADETLFASAIVMQAKSETTFERVPGLDVLVGLADIDLGSYDPDSEPLTLGLSTNGSTPAATLTLNETGDYAVILDATTSTKTASATCTVHVVSLPTPTGADVTWKGTAATALMARREWLWSDNWVGGVAPSNPTVATVYYTLQGMTTTGLLGTDRTVGGLRVGVSGEIVTHTLDLGGKALTVSNQLTIITDGTVSALNTLNMTNGTLRLGVSNATPAALTVGVAGKLRLYKGAVLACDNLGTVTLEKTGVIDLRGAALADGRLAMRRLVMQGDSQYSSLLYVDGTSGLDTIRITESLTMTSGANGGMIYIGDPNDNGRLPAGISLNVGTAATARAQMLVCEGTANNAANAKIVATAGGTFTGWISTLGVGTRSGSGGRLPRGTADFAAMTSCDLNISTLTIAPGDVAPFGTADEQGTLRLPPGNCTVGTATIGATAGIGYGLLETSNTVVTITTAMAIRATGDVLTRIGSVPGGLVIANAGAGAFSITPGATLTLRFNGPYISQPYYGFRWLGDHVSELAGLLADGRIVVNATGLGRSVEVFQSDGYTCIGVVLKGTVVLLR